MTKRRQKDASVGDITTQLKPLMDDDAFLTDLSRGIDPSDGSDELAALFLGLRDDVEEQMPPAPLIEGAEEEPVVISLAARRARRGRPFLSGIIGAAAATLVIAGSGSMLYNATPGSPLWGVSSSLFSDRAAVVELAGTLEEMDSRAAEGDMDGTRALLEEARRMLNNLQDANAETQTPQQAPRVTTTTTVVRPPEPGATEPEPPATETVTETSVQTETATVTVTQTPPPVRPNPLPSPVEPTPAPTPTSAVPDPSDPGPGDPTPTLAPPQIQVPG